MTSAIRSLCLGFWLLCCSLVQAATLNGVWSINGTSDYLLMMESTSGSVLVMRVKADLAGGTIYMGQRVENTVSANTLDSKEMLSLSLNNNSYTGTLVSSTANPSTLAGSLMLAYTGGPYDGVWQRTGASDRYLVTLSINLAGINTMLVLDTRLNGTSNSASYDVSTGAVVTSGASTGYLGRSLTSGNTVSHTFKGGTPAIGFYSVLTSGRPVTLVESFDTTQLLQVSTAP